MNRQRQAKQRAIANLFNDSESDEEVDLTDASASHVFDDAAGGDEDMSYLSPMTTTSLRKLLTTTYCGTLKKVLMIPIPKIRPQAHQGRISLVHPARSG